MRGTGRRALMSKFAITAVNCAAHLDQVPPCTRRFTTTDLCRQFTRMSQIFVMGAGAVIAGRRSALLCLSRVCRCCLFVLIGSCAVGHPSQRPPESGPRCGDHSSAAYRNAFSIAPAHCPPPHPQKRPTRPCYVHRDCLARFRFSLAASSRAHRRCVSLNGS